MPPHDSREPSDTEEEIFEIENEFEIGDDDYDPGDDMDELDIQAGDEEDMEDVENGYIPDDAVMTFTGHTSSVFAVGFNNDAQLAVSGGEDDVAYCWKVDTGDVQFKCTGHKDSVVACGFSADGKYLSSIDMAGLIQVWKVADGTKTWDFECGDIEWSKWHSNAPVLFCGTSDGEVYMFKIPSGDCKICQSHGFKSTSGMLLPDGKQLMSGYEDGSLKMWDLKTTTSTFSTKATEVPVNAIDCTSETSGGNLVAVGYLDGSINVFNMQGKLVAEFQDSNTSSAAVDSMDEEGRMGIESVAFSPREGDNLYLASAGLAGCVVIWDITQKKERHRCQLPSGVSKLIWDSTNNNQSANQSSATNNNPSSDIIICACLDGTIRIVNARSGKCDGQLSGHRADILDLQMSRDGRMLMSCSDDHTVKLFNIADESAD